MSLRSPGSRIPPAPSQNPTGPPVELEPPSDVLPPVVVPLALTAPVVPVLPVLPLLVLASVVVVPVVGTVPPLDPLAEFVLVAPVLLPSDVVGTPCVEPLVPMGKPVLDALSVPAPESPHPSEAVSTTQRPHRHAVVMPRSIHPPARTKHRSKSRSLRRALRFAPSSAVHLTQSGRDLRARIEANSCASPR